MSLLTVPVPDTLLQEVIEYRGLEDKYPELKEKLGKPFTVIDAKSMELDFYVTDDDFIFHNLENGNFLNKENILFRVFDPVEKKLRVTLNFQVLRRTAATLSQHSGTVKDIQGLLRHRNPDISMGEYAQVIPESTRAMINGVYTSLTKAAGNNK